MKEMEEKYINIAKFSGLRQIILGSTSTVIFKLEQNYYQPLRKQNYTPSCVIKLVSS